LDGINWIGNGSGGGFFTSNVNAVAWNGSIWVAGGGSKLGYSLDGITWTASANGSTIFNANVYCIAWNGTLWVAGGRTTFRLGYSSDGITWTGAATGNNIFATICYGIAWNGSLWIAAGRSAAATSATSTLAYSTDGITWNASTNGNSILSTHGYAVASRRVLPYVGVQQVPLKVRSNEAIAIGGGAGNSLQGTGSVAVGYQAGFTGQSSNSVAIGYQAGQYGLGSSSIAIGNLAGPTGLSYANTIVLNANGSALNPGTGSALYVAPVRVSTDTTNVMVYNTTSKEVTYNTTKTFIIDHPVDSNRYLVHACLEGPEVGVYYRGKGIVPENATSTVIKLPAYVSTFANNFTIQITPIHTPGQITGLYSVSELVDNTFEVHGQPGSFYWHVHGSRSELTVEPLKSEVTVKGDGPYRYIL
jgi:hypothetical protein